MVALRKEHNRIAEDLCFGITFFYSSSRMSAPMVDGIELDSQHLASHKRRVVVSRFYTHTYLVQVFRWSHERPDLPVHVISVCVVDMYMELDLCASNRYGSFPACAAAVSQKYSAQRLVAHLALAVFSIISTVR